MKLKIQTKILMITFILIAITSAGLTLQNINEVKKSMYSQMENQGLELAKSITEKIAMSNEFTDRVDKLMAERLLVASEGINEMPLSEMSNEKITSFVAKGTVDEIYVIGPDRKIKFSNIVDYVGWEYPKGHPMDPVFNGTSHSYMEAVRGDLISGKLNKYGGIALDNGYFVQVGINASTIAEIKKQFSPSVLLKQIENTGDIVQAYMVTKELTPEEQKKKNALEPYDAQKTIPVINADITEPDKYTEYKDKLGLQVFETGATQSQKMKDSNNTDIYELMMPYKTNDKVAGVIIIKSSLKRMNAIIASYLLKSTMVTVVILLLALIIGLLVINSVLKPLKVLNKQISTIASGDFTAKQNAKILSARDELGDMARSVEKMRCDLGTLVSDIKGISHNVEANADQLNTIMAETSNAVEENSKAMEVLAVAATEQARESERVSQSAAELGVSVEAGKDSITEVNNQVQAVENKNQQSERIIMDLAEVIKESIARTGEVSVGIGEVERTVNAMKEFMDRIHSISSQTNLLALNASIEAARAGEAGRGFAVVADEIRKLAEETNKTTEQVDDIIGKISSKTSVATEDIHSIIVISERQKDALQSTLSVFEEIKTAVKILGNSMNAVVKSINSVSEGKDTILMAVNKLADLTENLSATCEQISASTEEQAATILEVNSLTEKNRNVASLLENEFKKFKIEA